MCIETLPEEPPKATVVTVATANTQFGRMLTTKGGLEPLAHADVLLLQEVTGHGYDLEPQLAQGGFQVAHAVGACGLAIAVHEDSDFRMVEGSQREDVLQGPLGGRLADCLPHQTARRLRRRSMISVEFVGPAGETFTASSKHLIIPPRKWARKRQISSSSQVLQDPYFNGPLVLGGDMNHYPGPRAADLAMREACGLTAVDIGTQPTWRMRGSKQQIWGIVAAILQRSSLEAYDGQLDALLCRGGIEVRSTEVVDIASDHRAVVAELLIPQPQ